MRDAVDQEKDRLRSEISGRRRELAPAWVAEASGRVGRQVVGLPEFAAAAAVAGYLPTASEVQTRDVLEAAWRSGKSMYVPARRAATGGYDFARLTPTTVLVARDFGIKEPAEPEWAQPGELNLILVPGVAFDQRGHRLGHGRGYYDRLLARHDGCRCAMAFDFQMRDRVPAVDHDAAMDIVVTETRLLRPESCE